MKSHRFRVVFEAQNPKKHCNRHGVRVVRQFDLHITRTPD